MADVLNNPQFALPFRVSNGEVRCVEQDSVDDRVQNAITTMRYRPGERTGLPAFGLPDPVFSEGGADLDEIVRRVQQWEPDVEVEDITQTLDSSGTDLIEITFRGSPEE